MEDKRSIGRTETPLFRTEERQEMLQNTLSYLKAIHPDARGIPLLATQLADLASKTRRTRQNV